MRYPSISVCKRFAFLNNLYLYEPRTDTNYVDDDLYSNVWFHFEQFYFFTHPGAKNLTFPCTTLLGGTTPGKPCVFPIVYNGENWVKFVLTLKSFSTIYVQL